MRGYLRQDVRPTPHFWVLRGQIVGRLLPREMKM